MPRVVVSYDRDGLGEEYSDLTCRTGYSAATLGGTVDWQPVTQLAVYWAIRNAPWANAAPAGREPGEPDLRLLGLEPVGA